VQILMGLHHIPGANAAVDGIIGYRDGNLTVRPLQDYFLE
jgi:carbamoyl-phosphate synthase large subunit